MGLNLVVSEIDGRHGRNGGEGATDEGIWLLLPKLALIWSMHLLTTVWEIWVLMGDVSVATVSIGQ